MTKGYHDSNTKVAIRDLWQTPTEIFDWYNRRLHFDTDVAASADNHLTPNYLDEQDNALVCDWGVRNWCNPPYSDITPWVNKAIEQMGKGKLTVMLIPADTSVKWFKLAYENCSECHLISGRIAFINSETKKPVSGNNKGSVVFVFDPKPLTRGQTVLIERDVIMGKK